MPSASPNLLASAISTFSNFLSTVDTLTSTRLSLLPPRYSVSIHREALKRISRSYNLIWEAVMTEENRYEARHTLLRRSREDVELLLGVDES